MSCSTSNEQGLDLSQVTEPSPASSTTSQSLALTWQVHLLKRYPSRLPTLTLAILFGALCTAMIFHQLLPVLVVVLLLLSSVAEYLLPITFVIDESGVSSQCGWNRVQMSWSSIKRLQRRPKGILLSPLLAPSSLDKFRGLWLRFGRENEAGDSREVNEVLRHYLPNLYPLEGEETI